MEFKENSLGDISGMMQDQIPDLEWLAVSPGDNAVPVVNNPHFAVPQLEEAWGWESYRNPVTNLVPNTIMGGPGVVAVSPEEIDATVKVTKKAMMQGLKGPELLAHLRERVASEVIDAATPELVKLASQVGLLGNVYIDLSPFDTTREAALLLGGHKLRTASYAVGAPAKEVSFIDASGKARNIGLTVVASVQYTPELFAKYTTILRNDGRIAADETIKTEEELRTALTADPTKDVQVHAAEAVVPAGMPVDSSEILAAATQESEVAMAHSASQIRWASAKPVMSFIQSEMLAGKVGMELKAAINGKFTEEAVQGHMGEIARLASLQGLMGPVYVDVSLFKNADEAIKSIKLASSRPKYIIASHDDDDNRVERVASATGCLELPRSGVSVREASSIVRDLEGAGFIDSPVAASLNARLASGEATTNILRDAHLARATSVPTVREGGVYMHYAAGVRSASEVDRGSLRTASVAALSRGFPVSAIEDKVATSVPAGEAVTIVRQALSSMDVVPARSLEKCSTQRYTLNPGAKIACAPKCASCVLKVSGYCTKQASSMVGDIVEPIVRMATTNPVHEYQLGTPKIATSQIGDIDLSGIVRAPQVEASFYRSTGLDMFFMS